jgi:hypothetical protein
MDSGEKMDAGLRDSWVGDVDHGDVSHLCGSAEAASLRPVRREVSHELRPNAVYVSRLTKIRGGCREARLLRPRDDHNHDAALSRVWLDTSPTYAKMPSARGVARNPRTVRRRARRSAR